MDWIYIVLVAGFLVLSIALVYGCESLRRPQ
jgi:hypothetical protein